MKKTVKSKIKTLVLVGSSLLMSNAAMSQTVPFDFLMANCNSTTGYTGKSIIWNTSTFNNTNFGHKIYNDDYNGLTYLKFAARHAASNWTDAMTITSQGRIGIGTDAPGVKLELFDASTNLTLFKLRNNNWACNQTTAIEFWNGSNKAFATSKIVSKMDGCGSDGEALIFETQTAGATVTTPKLTIKNNGTILIPGQTRIGLQKPVTGTTHADAMLSVDGKIVSKSMYVTQLNWADFVFDKDYALPKLYEVEAYYKANKHLPLIPSEQEVKENGIDVGEMNKLLLQKIEEITILMVQQQREIDALKAKIK